MAPVSYLFLPLPACSDRIMRPSFERFDSVLVWVNSTFPWISSESLAPPLIVLGGAWPGWPPWMHPFITSRSRHVSFARPRSVGCRRNECSATSHVVLGVSSALSRASSEDEDGEWRREGRRSVLEFLGDHEMHNLLLWYQHRSRLLSVIANLGVNVSLRDYVLARLLRKEHEPLSVSCLNQ